MQTYFSADVSPVSAHTNPRMNWKGGAGTVGKMRGIVFLLSAAAAFVLVHSAHRTLPAGGGAMVTIPDTPPVAAITFDDGPRRDTTTRLLDELALREVPATFFLVGERIPGHEDLLLRMKAEGHQIGVHSWSHILLTDLSRADFDAEVAQTRRQLSQILGEEAWWLRPPYGILDASVQQWADSPVILWSLDPEDWKDRNASRIVNLVLSQVKDGDIILFHDIYDSSVDAALQIIDALTDRGWCFATVEQLLASRNIPANSGQIYLHAR